MRDRQSPNEPHPDPEAPGPGVGSPLTGRLIVIEGIDQSGKETQVRLLVRRLRWNGFKAEALSYPIYTSRSGREISAFLDGKRSGPPQVLHMLYSINRWESLPRLRDLLETSDFLVTDRYSPSNIAYGVAHGLDPDWLTNLDRGLPRPNLTVLVDTSVESSFARKPSGRDVHESDVALLQNVRKEYLKLARVGRWKVVDGNRPQQVVSDSLWEIVERAGHRPSGRSC